MYDGYGFPLLFFYFSLCFTFLFCSTASTIQSLHGGWSHFLYFFIIIIIVVYLSMQFNVVPHIVLEADLKHFIYDRQQYHHDFMVFFSLLVALFCCFTLKLVNDSLMMPLYIAMDFFVHEKK